MTTPPPPPEYMPPSGGSSSGDDKTMALIAHFGMIFFGFIPALIIYLVKGDAPWAKKEAAKAFNFTIIFTIVIVGLQIANVFLGLIFDDLGIIASCLTCLLIPAAWITNAVFGIMNGIKVNNGEESKYPFELPILK